MAITKADNDTLNVGQAIYNRRYDRIWDWGIDHTDPAADNALLFYLKRVPQAHREYTRFALGRAANKDEQCDPYPIAVHLERVMKLNPSILSIVDNVISKWAKHSAAFETISAFLNHKGRIYQNFPATVIAKLFKVIYLEDNEIRYDVKNGYSEVGYELSQCVCNLSSNETEQTRQKLKEVGLFGPAHYIDQHKNTINKGDNFYNKNRPFSTPDLRDENIFCNDAPDWVNSLHCKTQIAGSECYDSTKADASALESALLGAAQAGQEQDVYTIIENGGIDLTDVKWWKNATDILDKSPELFYRLCTLEPSILDFDAGLLASSISEKLAKIGMRQLLEQFIEKNDYALESTLKMAIRSQQYEIIDYMLTNCDVKITPNHFSAAIINNDLTMLQKLTKQIGGSLNSTGTVSIGVNPKKEQYSDDYQPLSILGCALRWSAAGEADWAVFRFLRRNGAQFTQADSVLYKWANNEAGNIRSYLFFYTVYRWGVPLPENPEPAVKESLKKVEGHHNFNRFMASQTAKTI